MNRKTGKDEMDIPNPRSFRPTVKQRDFDAEPKALDDKAREFGTRKVQQLGELVIATGADALAPEDLAGAPIVLGRVSAPGSVSEPRMHEPLTPRCAVARSGSIRCLPWLSHRRSDNGGQRPFALVTPRYNH